MSGTEQKKGLGPEMRILVASLLSMLVIIAWAKFFAPKPAPQTQQQQTQNAPAENATASQNNSTAPTGGNATAPATTAPANTTMKPAAAVAANAKSDSEERTNVVETDLYRVEFSNRGGVVKSWKLKKYKDDGKPQQTLDLVHPQSSQYLNAWPLSVVMDDANLEKAANTGLYIPSERNTLAANSELAFVWSDGHLEVTKRFKFDESYVVHALVTATLDGKPVAAGLAWMGGFGDLTVANPAPIETVSIFYLENGKLTNLPHAKLGNSNQWGPGVWQGGKDWAGIEDRYFAAAFLPPVGTAPGTLRTRYWNAWHPVKVDGTEKPEAVPEVAVASGAQPEELRIYVGPKDYDDLKRMNPPLNALVNFGWLEIVADPLFHGLKLVHKYIPNWGWAIVALTLVLNMVLFPLRISSYKTTLKMQRVAPQVKAINDKFKKYKATDPRRQEANQEIMALYKREGINPVGGCVPMLLQMPIWIGLNRALSSTIEMRHAPWFGWIKDLSAKDPYYILPFVMALSMYLVSKMTPMTTTDPQQQMMMKFMPITFAGMFIVFPISSGLAVYILTSSLVGIAQQWYLNRTHPMPAPGKTITVKN